MNVEKAIERLETFVERHTSPGYTDLIPAIKLGIEALKVIKENRVYREYNIPRLLLGETIEKE